MFMKKWLAVPLAIAIVLSLSVTALAESYPALNSSFTELTKKVDELFSMRIVGGDTKTGSLYTVRGYGDNWLKVLHKVFRHGMKIILQ